MKEARVALGGKSRKEATREEVLSQAKAERAARSDARRQHNAAVAVQAALRGHAVRTGLQQQHLQAWAAAYAASAAQPNALLPAADLQAGVVRLMLAAVLPLGSRRSRQLLRSGQPLPLSAGGSSCVRGSIALLLRSLGSQEPSLNWTAAATAAAAPGSEVHLAWRVQAVQLCQLCCLVTAGDAAAPNPVLDAAASRLVQLLTQQAAASSGGGSSLPSPAAAAAVLDGLLAQPMPLLRAASRCAQQHASQQQQQQQGQQAASPGGTLTAASALGTGLQRLSAIILLLLERQQPDQQLDQQHSVFVEQVVLVLLTTPGLVASLSGTTKARLLEPGVLHQLLKTAQHLAACGRLAGAPAASCFASIAQLLTGVDGSSGKRQQQQQQHSSSLAHGRTAELFVRAAMQLLAATSEPAAPPAPAGGGPPGAVLQEGCWMLGTQQHLLPLQQTLVQHSPDGGMLLWAGYCVHLLQASAGSKAAAPAAPTGSEAGLSSTVLNVLAFAPKLLPSLWDWLARAGGFPLEAPLQASRGLDIAAVAGGPEGLPQPVALVMGLFCSCLVLLLLVLDDADLHEHQTPFSLGASRAIASTLNSLVFHTSFIEPKGKQQPGQQRAGAHQLGATAAMLPATFRHGLGLLQAHAPTALRGLYERDARKPFCQPSLWTEPYSNMMARLQAAQPQQQEGGVLGLTAAVVQALLVSTGLQDEEGGSGSGAAAAPQQPAAAAVSPGSSRPGPLRHDRPGPLRHDRAAAASQGASIVGLRTGALLSLLRAAPQSVPFAVRLELFRQMLEQDKVRGRWLLSPAEGGPRPMKLRVRRDALLEDAFRGLAAAGPGIKGRIMVTFVNASGLEEAGLDHGGLMKELLEQVVAAGTQPEWGLFSATEETGLITNPAAEVIPSGLALLQFVGLMVGKALYEGILIGVSFAPFFLRSLQGGRPGLDDLAGLDATLYSNVMTVKGCPADQVEQLGLTFSAEQQLLGRTSQTDLLPGGESIAVNASNRLLYCHLLADWHLNARLGRSAAAFAAGLSSVLPPSWLRMFSPGELNQLISGGVGDGFDVADMAKHATYSNGYSESSHTVRLFWRAVADFTPKQRSALLRFVTSTSRAPLGGFRHLQPPLTIHKVDCGASPLALLGGKDVERLPSASTCFNMLKLPNYRRLSTLKEKLLYAIGAGAGFELS